jgi:hypothetical protein
MTNVFIQQQLFDTTPAVSSWDVVPTQALSLWQPWATLLALGYKDIENRNWKQDFRGRLLIHAAKKWDEDSFPILEGFWAVRDYRFHKLLEGLTLPEKVSEFPRGGLVGVVTVTDCVSKSNSKWFSGPYGFVLKDAQPLPFFPLRGQQKFFDVPEDVVAKLGFKR